jgi:hypothetical protein
MNRLTESLESQYRESGEAFGEAIRLGDPKAMDKNYKKRIAIRKRLRACGKQGEEILHHLMKNRSDAVAVWAAADSLVFAEADALEVLDAVAKKNGMIPFNARIIAEQWRAGELDIC